MIDMCAHPFFDRFLSKICLSCSVDSGYGGVGFTTFFLFRGLIARLLQSGDVWIVSGTDESFSRYFFSL